MAFVIDNSVALAWFVRTQATTYTKQLLLRAKREIVHAPIIWPFEFINTLWVMQKRHLLRAHEIDAIVARAGRLAIVVDSEPVAMPSLLSLVRQFALSAYDSSYLELAMRRGVPLATRDASLARAARAAGVLLK